MYVVGYVQLVLSTTVIGWLARVVVAGGRTPF
jgi:hypothetical protein